VPGDYSGVVLGEHFDVAGDCLQFVYLDAVPEGYSGIAAEGLALETLLLVVESWTHLAFV